MIDYSKWEIFVSTLNSEEIYSQLGNFSGFMDFYKKTLENELRNRLAGSYSAESNSLTAAIPVQEHPVDSVAEQICHSEAEPEERFCASGCPEDAIGDFSEYGIELDYMVISGIEASIQTLSEDQLLQEMKSLDEYLSTNTLETESEDYQENKMARLLCETRYKELYQSDSIKCSKCNTYHLPQQKFCGKCGHRLD